MKHANLSIFVPHAGCPNQCSFCNQKRISGTPDAPSGVSVSALCQKAAQDLQGRFDQAEIAFFGGSFTAIDQAYLLELLEAAQPFLGDGAFSGIRISTRPDCIDKEILELLKRYGVTAIELGAQSMCNEVLERNQRGHTAEDVENASRMITEEGFELGLQMMTGLMGSDAAIDYRSGEQIVLMKPKTVRIYPTIVMEGTALADAFQAGRYQPQSLEDAVELGAKLLDLFQERSGIRIIRMGLHAQESLEAGMLAGPYHPAFRELCEGRLLFEMIQKLLFDKQPGRFILRICPKSVSKITGHGASYLEKLHKLGYTIVIRQDTHLNGLAIELEEY